MSENISLITFHLLTKLGDSDSNFAPEAFYNKLKYIKPDVDKVNFVYNLIRKHDLFPAFAEDRKRNEIADANREKGNRLFASEWYLEALDMYTCSLSTAESKDIMALAYENRSACLMELKMFEECSVDIERAFNHGCPPDLKPKLIARKADALKALAFTHRRHEEIPTIPDSKQNKLIQCAKDCVAIKSSEEFGRHVVATRDIKIGEVIAVEKPFVAKAHKEKLIHCHECLKLCYNLIPCPNCTQTLYCNEDCQEKAFNDYHKYECGLLVTFQVIKLKSDAMTALKTTLLAINFQEEEFARNEGETYKSDRYKEIHNLIRHPEKIPPIVVLENSIIVAVVFKLLKQHSKLFEDQKMENKFKEIFFRQLRVACFNIMSVTEFAAKCFEKNVQFGEAIYSFGSLFNHSCCNNVDRYYYEAVMVLRATCTIRKGHQCFITYGPHFRQYSRKMRKILLSNFLFTCACRACEQDWTIHLSEEIRFPLILSSRDPREFFNEAARLEQGDVEVAKRMLGEFVPLLKKWERRPGKGYVGILKDFVYKCYTLFGNRREV